MAGPCVHVTAKIVNRKFDKQMVPKNPGPGLLHQAPTFVPEIGPAIKQFSGPSVAVNMHNYNPADSHEESTFYRPVNSHSSALAQVLF